jgi:Family of unknown function (DUF5329)
MGRRLLEARFEARACFTACSLALALMFSSAGSSVQAVTPEVEISHLLDFIGTSSCDFYRNGSWYTAAEARAHLDEKLSLVRKANDVKSAEAFIEKVATKSAFSNLPYRVRCRADVTDLVSDWLANELRRYRDCLSVAGRCTSRLLRDAPAPAGASAAPDVNRRVEP